MTLAVAACHCGCQHPSADPARRERHDASHRAFAEWIAEMPDWHGFRAPTGAEVLRRTVEEWDVPRDCPRLEDIGKPAHPAHT